MSQIIQGPDGIVVDLHTHVYDEVITEEGRIVLEALREHLHTTEAYKLDPALWDNFYDDAALYRLCRARNFDIKKVMPFLDENMAWRIQRDPANIRFKTVQDQCVTGKVRISDGYDHFGRKVLVMHNCYENSQDYDVMLQHTIWNIERACRLMNYDKKHNIIQDHQPFPEEDPDYNVDDIDGSEDNNTTNTTTTVKSTDKDHNKPKNKKKDHHSKPTHPQWTIPQPMEPATHYVIVMNMENFSYSSQPPMSVSKEVAGALGTAYPERLGAVIILNAPFMFRAVYKMLSVVLDKRTVNKVFFVKEHEMDSKLSFLLGPYWKRLSGIQQPQIDSKTAPGFIPDEYIAKMIAEDTERFPNADVTDTGGDVEITTDTKDNENDQLKEKDDKSKTSADTTKEEASPE